MMHRQVKKLLYEYLREELDSSKRIIIERHLGSCSTCANELAELTSAVDALDLYSSQPSEERTQEFWNAFAFQVEDRLKQGKTQSSVRVSFKSLLEKVLLLHRRTFAAYSSGIAVVVVCTVGLLLFRDTQQPAQEQLVEQPVLEQQVPVELVSDRLHKYFRKSKVLLVGIANMNADEEEPIDLSAERRLSRNLIHEARYLQNQPLDKRSARLINDLEKILIELANMEEQSGLSNVEILRGGIHQENLLFKIRMAESMYDTSNFLIANNKY